MRLPKRGERGFTLIELLIVVAILGVLAAVVIPNVQRFVGTGKEEAIDTEFANIQAAVSAMMVDNALARLPTPVDITGNATKDMGAFPDTSVIVTVKVKDPTGVAYILTDKSGYLLYRHDIIGGDGAINLVNYVATPTTAYYYTVDAFGTVSQYDDAAKTTKLN